MDTRRKQDGAPLCSAHAECSVLPDNAYQLARALSLCSLIKTLWAAYGPDQLDKKCCG